ncbi:putative glutamine transport system permease protein [Paenibacillus shirakamiensis]|uniref:Glutamine transport system permease protein n=1 Tax=Paenibacillus shirakamiensis TaxID=1265935 RepID=A0ABS4JHU5_9BACL|nr:amino acid ABC transporter permease [Paenibacillus shirakamiensis]MBP2000635.1 putative glutamine transport system permease protein [Paenibacillus shirakamiensis]
MDFSQAYSVHNVQFVIEGFLYTLLLAAVAIVFSFILGVALGVVRYSHIPIVSPVIGLIVETLRNLPLLLLIFFTYFALPQVGLKMSPFWAAVTALTLFEAAMICEIVRSGLASVNKGIVEASQSSGMTRIQTLRCVTLPIGLRRMVPPLVSQFISLLKDTSLAVIIALPELMHNAQIVMGQGNSVVFPTLFLAALLYFIVNYSLSRFSRRLESQEGKHRGVSRGRNTPKARITPPSTSVKS